MNGTCVRVSGSDNVLKLPRFENKRGRCPLDEPWLPRIPCHARKESGGGTRVSGRVGGGGRGVPEGGGGRHIAAVRKGLKHHRFNLCAQSQLQIMPPPLKRFCRRSGLDDPR